MALLVPAPVGAGDVPAAGASASAPLAVPRRGGDRHITRTDWRWDEEGHRDRWSHLFVLERPAVGRARYPRGLGRRRYRLASRRPHDRVHARIAAGAGPAPADDDLGGGRGRRPGGEPARDPGARRLGDPPGVLAGRPWVAAQACWRRSRSTTSARGSWSARPTARGRHASCAPDLDRPIGNWVDRDLTGWMVSAARPVLVRRPTASSRRSRTGAGRIRTSFTLERRRGRRASRALGRPASATTHTIARRRGPATVAIARRRDGTRAMELIPSDRRQARTRRPRTRSATRVALAGRLRAARDASASRRPGPADRSTSGSRPRRLPADEAAADGRRRPRRPARGLGAVAPRRGHPARSAGLSRGAARTSAARRRTAATGSGRSSATGAASMPPTSMPRSTTSSSSASPTRIGSG